METPTLAKPKPTAPVAKLKTATLNTTHRCDRCGAQAWVKVTLRKSERLPQGGYLLFCGHDYHAVEAGIAPFVADLLDERHRLVTNRLKGSEN